MKIMPKTNSYIKFLEITVYLGSYFAGTNFRGSTQKTFFAGTNFRGFFEKPRNPRKLIPAKINTNKVYGRTVALAGI